MSSFPKQSLATKGTEKHKKDSEYSEFVAGAVYDRAYFVDPKENARS
jgi:hypothetical protein